MISQDQEKFLQLAVIEGKTYPEIEKILGIPRKEFAPWWEELKDERLKITQIRSLWKQKCPELTYMEFATWYQQAEKQCYYCGLDDQETAKLWERHPDLTKRTRGRVLEIDRISPNKPYNDFDNLVFACYWCNNAKTDTFTGEEFKKVGKVFREIWEDRLK